MIAKKNIYKHLFKILFGVSILLFVLWKYDFLIVWNTIKNTSMLLWLLAWLSVIIGMWFHSMMLNSALCLYNINITTFNIFKLNWELRFFALFLPGATNMLVKWYKLGKGGHAGQALIVIGFTRIIHTMALLLLTTLGILLDAEFPWPLMRIIIIILLSTAILLIAISLSEKFSKILEKVVNVTVSNLSKKNINTLKIEKIWYLIKTLQSISLYELLKIFLITAIGQTFLTMALIILSFSLDINISIYTQFWLRGIIMVCAIIPLTISGIGLREVSLISILVFYNVEEHLALSYSLLHLAITLASGIIGGFIELTNHINMSQIKLVKRFYKGRHT